MAMRKEDLVLLLTVISIINPTVLPVIKKSLSQRSSLSKQYFTIASWVSTYSIALQIASHWWSPLAWFRRQGESSATGGHLVDEMQKVAVESAKAPAQ